MENAAVAAPFAMSQTRRLPGPPLTAWRPSGEIATAVVTESPLDQVAVSTPLIMSQSSKVPSAFEVEEGSIGEESTVTVGDAAVLSDEDEDVAGIEVGVPLEAESAHDRAVRGRRDRASFMSRRRCGTSSDGLGLGREARGRL